MVLFLLSYFVLLVFRRSLQNAIANLPSSNIQILSQLHGALPEHYERKNQWWMIWMKPKVDGRKISFTHTKHLVDIPLFRPSLQYANGLLKRVGLPVFWQNGWSFQFLRHETFGYVRTRLMRRGASESEPLFCRLCQTSVCSACPFLGFHWMTDITNFLERTQINFCYWIIIFVRVSV